MNIPFLDLKRQYISIAGEINEAIKRVLEKQSFVLGTEVESFEREFSEYIGTKYTVSVDSGTDALLLSLRALGIGKGDEVITPVNSFIATTLAITELDATPIFVDCDPRTYQLDVAEVEKKITKKTKAILPVHLYGSPCDIGKLAALAKREQIYLVEDACQAHGASVNNKKVGTFGDIGTFSFYPGKNLGAYGDGGAIVTNNEDFYKHLVKLRNYGQSRKYYHDEIGINSRLDEIQAAVLRVKLPYLDTWNKKRNEIATRYKKNLTMYPYQTILDGAESCYHLFVIESPTRDQLMKYLSEKGVHTLIHYPVPIHIQKCYESLGYKVGDFPNSERIAHQILSLPLYPELTSEEVGYITAALQKYL